MNKATIFVLVVFSSVVCSAKTDTVTVVVFRSATLRCPIEGAATEQVTWRFVKLGTEEEVEVYGKSRVVDKFNDTIYANFTRDGEHELFLPNTTWKDAGDYYCLDKTESILVQLIVLESDPICEPQPTAGTLLLNGTNALELSCTVWYWGNEPPSMQWNILGGPSIPSNNTTIPNTSGRSMVNSFIKVTHNSTFVRKSSFNFACTTSVASYTPDAKTGIPVRSVKNPGYTHVWFSSDVLNDWQEPDSTQGSEPDVSTIPGGTTHTSRGSSQAGEIHTYRNERSESSPPDMFQIVTTTLLSVICLLLLVVFVAIVMVKCFRANNHDHHKEKEKIVASSGSDPKQTSYTPLGLEMEPVKRMDKPQDHLQRGSSEYYCQIDESLMREIEGDNPGTVTPDSPLGLGYIELHDDDVGATCYDECNSTGPIQVHTYEGRVASTDQENSDDFQPKASSYDQLESVHRSEPPELPVYRCLNTERKELQDDANKNYEQCKSSGPNPVHTYEKSREKNEQGEMIGDLELKVSKYDQLEPTHKSGPLKPSEYKRLNTERKETGYIQLLADEAEENGGTSYEQCKTSGSKPEDRSAEPGVKASNYDQLEPGHRSKPPKPAVYKCLDTKLQRRN